MDRLILRSLGRTGLSAYPVGFGCYRIGEENSTHEAALRSYLDRGGNLADTSANYTDGQSERLVGRVIKDYPRDRLIIVTKGGYIQGQNMWLAQSRSFPEVVHYADGLWHCIHPEFLETQIRLSSERLQVGTMDVFLLHNPEYYLTHIAHQRKPTAEDHDEFYRRIREAFRFLEGKVGEGRIRWYGISSNHYGLPTSDPTMTSVSRCLAAAREVSADHHFGVVQLPMNLYESGGALEENNNGRTVLRFCQSNGIGVLANRPLNAFSEGQLIRLADFIGQQGLPDAVRRRLTDAGYPLTGSGERLSQMAIRVLLSLSGLSCVLVGMRRTEYVQDLMALPMAPPVNGEEILRSFQAGPNREGRG